MNLSGHYDETPRASLLIAMGRPKARRGDRLRTMVFFNGDGVL